jgi:hypothetical protein
MPADGTLAAITPAEISASSRRAARSKDCTRPQQKQLYRDGRPHPRNGFGTSRRKRSVEISAGGGSRAQLFSEPAEGVRGVTRSPGWLPFLVILQNTSLAGPSAQRYWIATVRPSIQPSSCSRWTKAAVHGAQPKAQPSRGTRWSAAFPPAAPAPGAATWSHRRVRPAIPAV